MIWKGSLTITCFLEEEIALRKISTELALGPHRVSPHGAGLGPYHTEFVLAYVGQNVYGTGSVLTLCGTDPLGVKQANSVWTGPTLY